MVPARGYVESMQMQPALSKRCVTFAMHMLTAAGTLSESKAREKIIPKLPRGRHALRSSRLERWFQPHEAES